MQEEKTILRFSFESLTSAESETEIFIRMNMPTDADRWNNRMMELEDCISIFFDSVLYSSYDECALDIAKSFDPNAEVVAIPTIRI